MSLSTLTEQKASTATLSAQSFELVCDGADHINQLRYGVENADLSGTYVAPADLIGEVIGGINRAANELTDIVSDIEAGANEAAFDAGVKNVPRERLHFETQAQEEAYNAGRMEHIKNMNSDNAAQKDVENAPNKKYTVSDKSAEKAQRQARMENTRLKSQKTRYNMMSPERQEYVKAQYEKHRETLEKVKTGDLLIDADGNILAEVNTANGKT